MVQLQLREKHDYFNMFKKVKAFVGMKRFQTLIDENGKFVMSIKEKELGAIT